MACIVLNFVTYFQFAIDPWVKGFLYIVLVLNVLASVVSLGTMVSRKVVSDVDVTERKERFLPVILTLIYYSASYTLLRFKLVNIYIPNEMYSMLLGVLVSLILALVITSKFKISLHAVGISGVVGVLAGLGGTYEFDQVYSGLFWITASIATFGLIGFSRITTGHHSVYEIISGGLLGFLVNYWLVSNAWFI